MRTGSESQRRASAAPKGSVSLVSVVVPVLNGERYLRESLDSILAQTYPNIEVLVLDDGSADGTQQIVGSYGDAIAYCRQPVTRGIYGNANDGIARASGEFVCVYHADDVYLPTIVEREVAFFQRYPEAGAVFAADIFVDKQTRETGRLALPAGVTGSRPLVYADVVNTLLIHKNAFLRCPTAMVRAAVYRDVGVYRDDTFKNTSDLEMWLRISRKYAIGVLERPQCLYRRGHASSSERYHHLRTEPERFFRIMDLELAAGALDVATPEALKAYEAHRAEDRLMIAISSYVKSSCEDAHAALQAVNARALRKSAQVQRARLLALFCLLWLLVRVPRIGLIARLFQRRWYGGVGGIAPVPMPTGGAPTGGA